MQLVLFDPFSFGHHATFRQGIADAAAQAGHEAALIAPREDWISGPVPASVDVSLSTPDDADLAGALQTAVDKTIGWGADLFCNLSYDRYAVLQARQPSLPCPSVCVLHTSTRRTRSSGVRASVASLMRRRALSRELGRSTFVVHTEAARRQLTGRHRHAHVVHLPYPDRPRVPAPAKGDPEGEILFVGRIRPSKGLPALLDALDQLGTMSRLRVVGRQGNDDHTAALLSRARAGGASIESDWLSPERLDTYYRAAALIVAPYDETYEGSASGIALEALGYGIPLVTTPPVAQGLPPDYAGVVVSGGHEANQLATALDAALSSIADLRVSAQSAGPTWIAREHGYERYVNDLLREATSGGNSAISQMGKP